MCATDTGSFRVSVVYRGCFGYEYLCALLAPSVPRACLLLHAYWLSGACILVVVVMSLVADVCIASCAVAAYELLASFHM